MSIALKKYVKPTYISLTSQLSRGQQYQYIHTHVSSKAN